MKDEDDKYDKEEDELFQSAAMQHVWLAKLGGIIFICLFTLMALRELFF